jgi:hypothetical protein
MIELNTLILILAIIIFGSFLLRVLGKATKIILYIIIFLLVLSLIFGVPVKEILPYFASKIISIF